MGRGIDSYIKEQFGIAEVDIRTYSPLTLAYIGDGIYDLVIRSVVVGKGNTRAGELHKRRKYRASAIGRGCYRQQKESAGSREKRRIHGIRGIKNRGTQCCA